MRAQDTATTCRERCGGQGYLSVNRFGAILGFAHAGMTAEGDNRVLMQKVKHSACIPSQAPQKLLSDRPLPVLRMRDPPCKASALHAGMSDSACAWSTLRLCSAWLPGCRWPRSTCPPWGHPKSGLAFRREHTRPAWQVRTLCSLT